ncbi:MAG: riboflavin biosynthesis protein RibF [Candidatus Omnitrophica bacterium CG1_02_49_10]|nr:MAG: riboflavin biosynthesis protein RibF [Candidatus Omnitrophica bacterium CG1_02_49_10]
MKVIYGIHNLRSKPRKAVLAIGVFDGVHLGHRKVISGAVRTAGKIGGESVVVTFDPHPADIFASAEKKPLIVSLKHRIKLISELGVDICLVVKFTGAFADLTPEKFITGFLLKKFGLHTIVIGDDYRFGRRAKGTASAFKSYGRRYGFRVRAVKKLIKNGLSVSSSRIRALIKSGHLKEAATLLGRRVEVLGTVIRGSRIGRRLGYPTANIDPHHEVIPPDGVYVVIAHIVKKRYPGLVNIGRRPTLASGLKPTVELHVLKYRGMLYGKTVSIGFIKKLRDELKFRDLAGLVEQIRKDEEKGLSIFTKYESHGIL